MYFVSDPGDHRPWYRRGLQFRCTQCGNCCSGAPGYVYITPAEIERVAAFLQIEDGRLPPSHLRRVGNRFSLTELDNGDCIFLKNENGKRTCGVYPVRPLQCRTWPFWDANLKSSDDWTEAARDCPGMNVGPVHAFVQIESLRTARRWEDAEP